MIALAVTVALLGGCGAGGADSKQDLAAQDKAVEAGDRIALERADVAAVRRRLAEEHAARAAAAALRQASGIGHGLRVLQAFGFTVDDLCAPHAPRPVGTSGKRARRLVERRRTEVLDYLNLSCPSA